MKRYLVCKIQGESKEFMRFAGCGMKSMRPIFKTTMLFYQSEANVDDNFVWKSHPSLRPKTRKMPTRGFYGNENSTFHSGP